MQDQSQEMPTGAEQSKKPRTIKERVQGFMPKIPDIGEVTRMLDDRFGVLIGKLDEMLGEQRETNRLLRERNGQ